MSFEYSKICRLCLNASNTYLMNIFNNEYSILDKIADLMNVEIFSNDPFPKVICTDCYSNLVIFNEFKNICRNSDNLLKKYQINKQESPDVDTSHGTKGNGKCKSIRNSEEMANRIKECAYKKSITFIENMKNFYFLMHQIEDLESNGGHVIIKNEIASESLIPTVELNIKNEIIYPNEEGHHQVIMSSVIHQNQQEQAPVDTKRKKRKNNKRKLANGQTTMEIDESGNLVARQIVTTQEHHQQQTHPSNLHITQHHNENHEMALMLTVKHADSDHSQPHTITVSNPHHAIQPIQIHSNHPLPSLTSTVHHTAPTTSSQISIHATPHTVTTIMPQIQYSCSSCNEIFANTDTLRQHLFQQHQILFPPFTPSSEHQYQLQLPQSSINTTATIQPVAQQYTFTHPHKKYFSGESDFPCLLCGVVSKSQDELIKHMIKHTSQPGPSNQISTIVDREQLVIDSSSNQEDPRGIDLSNSTQYK